MGELPVWRPEGYDLEEGVLFAVTTRDGGRSPEPWDSLNLSYAVGDSASRVSAHRRKVGRELGYEPDRLIMGQQAHAPGVAVVDGRDSGRGAFSFDTAIAATDALITGCRSIPVAITIADCAPLLICDRRKQAIALIHVGWRGALEGIVLRAAETLLWRFGCRVRDLRAEIGPHIGPCCLEVGEEVASAFGSRYERQSDFGLQIAPRLRSGSSTDCGLNGIKKNRSPFRLTGREVVRVDSQTNSGRSYVSLQAAIVADLESLGVPCDHLVLPVPCTRCESRRFFSHRASGGKAGRMLAIAMLR